MSLGITRLCRFLNYPAYVLNVSDGNLHCLERMLIFNTNGWKNYIALNGALYSFICIKSHAMSRSMLTKAYALLRHIAWFITALLFLNNLYVIQF